MFLPVANGNEFEIIVKAVNLSTIPVSGRIFLIFPEYLNNNSFRKDITLTNFEDEKNIRTKIVLKKPPDDSDSLSSLGEIKFHVHGESLVKDNLPPIRFVNEYENVVDYLGILLVLNGKKSYTDFRCD